MGGSIFAVNYKCWIDLFPPALSSDNFTRKNDAAKDLKSSPRGTVVCLRGFFDFYKFNMPAAICHKRRAGPAFIETGSDDDAQNLWVYIVRSNDGTGNHCCDFDHRNTALLLTM